ncbi:MULTISPECIES: permease [unclassified Cryobacterium]|uniref:permease n=1 Tax=unclassified Cryobacterium TaxID=2649013 RepID=UPI002AB50261|nr:MULTISPECIES: permease [unclassified Cryobacterium]MDY7543771.1 permease [Cryobacterium sp. 5B3]MEA9997577.1 permease [Cryobacterium sp. RTS3]MEB0264258.1 permease [Cryobacterium sp. 10I5]MEB0273440.1 permease [Cryobacterium sp. 5B3]
MDILQSILNALLTAASMAWQILWPLVFGFTTSGIIQAVVRKERITRLMADDSPRAISVASILGAASSSCSYAAVALARALFRKGASFTSAMAFQIASTNLVLELGLILAFVMGWQFTLAEFVGGPIMIILVALGFRLWMGGRIVDAARQQAEKGVAGSMEGHAAMDMSVQSDRGFLQRLFSSAGMTSVSRYFVMDWAAVLRDIVIGLLIAGAFAAWVPKEWLQAIFFQNDPTLSFLLGPLIGPLLAMISFVCSVGNVPLAAVLWNGGISFGGVVSFIFADLIIIPIILIYKKYYGWKPAARITAIFYGAMVLAGYAVELLFIPLSLVPADRNLTIVEAGISWNYTTWLNIAAIVLAGALLIVFFRSGSRSMLAMMGGSPEVQDGTPATDEAASA